MQNLQQNSKIPLSEKIEYFKQLQEKVLAFEAKLISSDLTIKEDSMKDNSYINSNLFDYNGSVSLQKIPNKDNSFTVRKLDFGTDKELQNESSSLIFSDIKDKKPNQDLQLSLQKKFLQFSSIKKLDPVVASSDKKSALQNSLNKNDLNYISLLPEEQEFLDVKEVMDEFRKILLSIPNLGYKDGKLSDNDCQKVYEIINTLDICLDSALTLQKEIDEINDNLKDIFIHSKALIELKNKYKDKELFQKEQKEVLDEVRSIEDNIKSFKLTDYAKDFITLSVSAFLRDKNAEDKWFQTVSSAVAGHEMSKQFNRQQDEFEKVEKVLEILKSEISSGLESFKKEKEEHKIKVVKRPQARKNHKTRLKPNENIQTMRDHLKTAFTKQ